MLLFPGIPDWDVFKALYDLVEPDLPVGPKLSKLNTLMMFFLRVRLSYGTEDLAFRFGVTKGQVSKHFHNVLDIVYVKTKSIVKWPDRDVLRLTMPTSFRNFFKKCAVIIDCSEVFIEIPSDLMARAAQVWSNYKHHSTIKFLIGITPQGTVSYISKCAGGRISDREIVEQSSLVKYLLPGQLTYTLFSSLTSLLY